LEYINVLCLESKEIKVVTGQNKGRKRTNCFNSKEGKERKKEDSRTDRY
jgi:hypothetical protein